MRTEQYITRLEAAERLHVSLRTLDRYIRRRKMKVKRDGKNLLILESDILPLQDQEPLEQHVLESQEPQGDLAEGVSNPSSLPMSFGYQEALVFKRLLEEAQKHLERKEEKIELLNYKLGQVEMKLKQSVPLLEHQQSSLDTQAKFLEKEAALLALKSKYGVAALTKNIYLVLLLATIILVPFLWFILPR